MNMDKKEVVIHLDSTGVIWSDVPDGLNVVFVNWYEIRDLITADGKCRVISRDNDGKYEVTVEFYDHQSECEVLSWSFVNKEKRDLLIEDIHAELVQIGMETKEDGWYYWK